MVCKNFNKNDRQTKHELQSWAFIETLMHEQKEKSPKLEACINSSERDIGVSKISHTYEHTNV